MKPSPFAYHSPESVEDAIDVLGELGHDGKVLSGGQSLLPLLNMRLAAPAAIVDINRLDELDTIEVTDDAVRVGARARQRTLERHAAAADAQPLLREALGWVAHPVVRNRGTVVGSVVHADPAAEMTGVLVLLDGEVELRSRDGSRSVPAADFLIGPLEADLQPGELAVAVRFPTAPPRTGTAVAELARRHGDYAMAGAIVSVTADEGGAVTGARAAMIGVGDTAVVVDLDDAMSGPADDVDVRDAVEVVRTTIDPLDDIHATASYRRHLAGVLVGRALRTAGRRAVGAPDAEPPRGDDPGRPASSAPPTAPDHRDDEGAP